MLKLVVHSRAGPEECVMPRVTILKGKDAENLIPEDVVKGLAHQIPSSGD